MSIPDRRAATEGEAYGLGKKVAPKSPGNRGRWYCITCEAALDHNMAKDIHCGRKRPRGSALKPGGSKAPGQPARHVLGWLSFETGKVEVP